MLRDYVPTCEWRFISLSVITIRVVQQCKGRIMLYRDRFIWATSDPSTLIHRRPYLGVIERIRIPVRDNLYSLRDLTSMMWIYAL